MEHKVHVFVYGTLKRRHGNSGLMTSSGGKFIRYESITGKYRMVTLGGIPAVEPCNALNTIRGELWELPAGGLLALDALEGHPRWYRRERIETDEDKVRAWIYLQPASDRPQIPYNIWRPTDDEKAHWLTTNPNLFREAS